MGRIQRTIELAKASGRVLAKDRELALLPVLSFVVNLVVAAGFLGLVLLVGGDELFDTSSSSTSTSTGFDASPFVYLLGIIG